MKYQKLSEFRFLRDLAIILAVKETGATIQRIIKLPLAKPPKLNTNLAKEVFQEYLDIRNVLFQKEGSIFITDENRTYLQEKFKQNYKRLLLGAGIPNFQYGPASLTYNQIDKLMDLKFLIQRPNFQVYLASALLGFQALRPNEIAKLHKNDVFLEEGTILLRDTKSREDQQIVIYPNLIEPLKRYIGHIKDNEPLFVRESNKQWVQKDVYRAIKNFSHYYNQGNITPRKLRATVSNYMINSGIPIKFVSIYLRHKDVATTLRHYMAAAGIDESRIASKYLHAILTGQAESFRDISIEAFSNQLGNGRYHD